ncbi:protein-L-isoaspartate(D-aspartate) O-methyltransferase [Actinomadura sp. LD22]|uniref:Protein-L-isoaspartate O-methyltransferase n=1 Tax=Actinomadura physcomitrii TaxID=2650748 RepID=A0A6I4MIT5_9ACTN|nr:methyltransferase domain-containing protein [Actinomadura physcomitrii]MWA04084.1 protein-L-isoaspartate(D-aspartate) O-methyltransferase [Actinomadura physcomitrii]
MGRGKSDLSGPEEVAGRIDALADELAGSGDLTDPAWRTAMHAVPRHLFVPPVAWAWHDGLQHRIDAGADPAAWWDAAYANQPIITQYDDGDTALEVGGGKCTSSLSAPDVVLRFLELLRLEGRPRVLEIGTGTGWTAGLLSSRVGADNVTSVEVDGRVAKQAAANLEAAGLQPVLVVGDGADGHPGGAPHDAVHVTCGVTTVPYAWVRQTRPGGVIVFPWMPEYGPGRRVRLVVDADGRASGTFHGRAAYMMLRSQRTGFPDFTAEGDSWDESVTSADVRRILWDTPGPATAITGCVPDLMATDSVDGGDGSVTMWIADTGHSSQAIVDAPWGMDGAHVRQRGPRRLWDEFEAAYRAWLERGSPAPDRFGMTVGPDGQYLWLDAPR